MDQRDHRGDEDRWQQQRYQDRADRRQRTRADDARRLLQRGIDVAEGRDQENVFRRDRARGEMREDDAGEGIDVEHRLRDAEASHQSLIDHAVIRIEEQDPAEQHRQRRQEEGYPHEIVDQSFARQIAARDQPRHTDGERQRDHLRRDRPRRRVEKRRRHSRLAPDGEPGREAVSAAAIGAGHDEAAIDQQRQRIEDQETGDQEHEARAARPDPAETAIRPADPRPAHNTFAALAHAYPPNTAATCPDFRAVRGWLFSRLDFHPAIHGKMLSSKAKLPIP